ncbi:ATP-binding protein [Desulfovibrio aminophilus]|uniref:sensor histidine kinase n=1 Tax=Desulfovibrio aminophilus TaxID=81425 RepID=UPI0033984A3D
MNSVLLVDDERDFTDTLAERLRARGFAVRTAYRGEEALEALRRADSEVVVLDLGLPGMDGFEVLRAARALRPQTEFVLLTADNSLDTVVTGMKLGARDYLVKPAGTAAVARAIEDAADRRRHRQARLRMTETAKLAALGELAKGVAHEINNPLNIMINEAGWIEDLLEDKEFADSPQKPEMLRAVARIHAQAERCKAITSKLLTLRRAPDAPGAATSPEFLTEVLRRREERARELNVRLEADIPEGFPALPHPPADLEMILSNLADNALDAMSGTGGVLRLGLALEDGEAVMRVADTGPGVEPALQQRIFEPFFSTKEVGKGTGLGLAICWSLVEALGGRITIYSEKGRGARFSVRLPMTERKTEGTNG